MNQIILPDAQALRWLLDMGVTDLVNEVPQPWIGQPQAQLVAEAVLESKATARPVAAPIVATTLAELYAAIAAFEDCPLKKTATNSVVFDGQAASRVMIIGEAPGAEEDRLGKAFVGRAGQLLNQMLAAIGRDRHAEDAAKAAYLTNMLFWRPPGGRQPTPHEVALCQPFLAAHITLVDPVAILAVGPSAIAQLTGSSAPLSRLRGRWHSFESGGKSYPVLPSFDPGYLIRQPKHKNMAWDDVLMFKQKLMELQS
jgi:uracil-DNA glycosylase